MASSKQFGMATVVTLLDERIRTQPDGQIYSTITHGKNTMGAYGPRSRSMTAGRLSPTSARCKEPERDEAMCRNAGQN